MVARKGSQNVCPVGNYDVRLRSQAEDPRVLRFNRFDRIDKRLNVRNLYGLGNEYNAALDAMRGSSTSEVVATALREDNLPATRAARAILERLKISL
jgi:hypothetical protein